MISLGNFSNVHIEGNTFTRTPANQGKKLQDVFDWARKGSTLRPQNVPGVNDFDGAFSKTSNLPSHTLDLASIGTEMSGNNTSAIVHSGNTWVGSGWTNTIT